MTLDELVPVYSEPDGGKLRSGRTVTQLLHDLVSYTKSLMSPVKQAKKVWSCVSLSLGSC